jgi:hypothetical protein
VLTFQRRFIVDTLAASGCLFAAACAAATPESRAVAYLAREVPAWPVENKCFSCHNNGDAARALFAARRDGFDVPPRALESTARFLARPEEWRHSGPEGPFSDKRLAAIQFAHALASSDDPGPALARAAELVRQHREPDGSWAVDQDGLPGSPVTYGRTLATVVARRVLERAGLDASSSRAWLAGHRPDFVADAAALLIDDPSRPDCLEMLRKAQGKDGGWGPYVVSPPEPFDTAIALLALAPLRGRPGVDDLVRRGRDWLAARQQADGSWPETVRPPGAESYAQRISTTGWALLALLRTRELSEPRTGE